MYLLEHTWKPTRDIPVFKNRVIIIVDITVISLIGSILFYVVALLSNQTNAIYLFDLVTGILAFEHYTRMRKSNNHSKFLLQHF
jgi:hypothetical protein